MELSCFLIRELISSYAQLTLMHIFCAVNSIYWLTLWGCFTWFSSTNQISPWPLPTTNLVPVRFEIWTLSRLFGAVSPSLPLRALPPPFTSLLLILALKWINTKPKTVRMCASLCILRASTHAFWEGAPNFYGWVEIGGGKKTNLIHKVINLDRLFFLLLLFSLFYDVCFI